MNCFCQKWTLNSHCGLFRTVGSSWLHAIVSKYPCSVDQCGDAYATDCYPSVIAVFMVHQRMLGVSAVLTAPHASRRLLSVKL